jgi:hypothetical protein
MATIKMHLHGPSYVPTFYESDELKNTHRYLCVLLKTVIKITVKTVIKITETLDY